MNKKARWEDQEKHRLKIYQVCPFCNKSIKRNRSAGGWGGWSGYWRHWMGCRGLK